MDAHLHWHDSRRVSPGFAVTALQNRLHVTIASVTTLLIVGAILFVFNPVGYAGGLWDDGRYLERAADWMRAGGPVLGHDHWGLRWPVLIDPYISLRLFGPDREGLMLMPLLGWLATGGLLFVMMLRRWGHAAAFAATFAFIASPELMAGATRIGADLRELLFWTASLWTFVSACDAGGDEGRARRRLILSGFLAALAFAVRETSASLLLLYGLVFLHGGLLPRRRFLWLAAGFLPPFLIEQALWFAASGDPLYRFRTDMAHVTVPSYMMDGMVAKEGEGLARWDVAARWLHPGPVNLWWPVNPFLNLLFRIDYGLLFWVMPALLLTARLLGLGRPRDWSLALLLLAAGAIQMAVNIFVLAVDPQPRMFLPAVYLACVLCGLAVRWLAEGGHLALAMPGAALLLGGGLWGLDAVDNFAGVERAGTILMQGVPGPVHADGYSRSHLALMPAPERARLLSGLPPLGGLALTVQRPMWPDDTINRHLFRLPPGQCWQAVSAIRTGRMRLLFLFANARNPDVAPDRLMPPFRVALYRRLAGTTCTAGTM